MQVPDFANKHTPSVVMSAPEAVCFIPTTYCETSQMQLLHQILCLPPLLVSLLF